MLLPWVHVLLQYAYPVVLTILTGQPERRLVIDFVTHRIMHTGVRCRRPALLPVPVPSTVLQ
eukprot:SAG22_NODE_2271_length_2767_cov_2.952547_3_plen_62_part_00